MPRYGSNNSDSKGIKESRSRRHDYSPSSRRKSNKDKKHKSKKRYDSSSDSDNSSDNRRRNRRHDSESSSDEESRTKDMMQRLELEKQRKVEEKVRVKERMKALETPEEKYARRLAKKQAKELLRKQPKSGANAEEYIQYTNDDNPFGDSNLTETFVWTKKLQGQGVVEVDREQLQKEARRKLEENRRELEKVKERRLQREREKADREKEMESEQRSREAAQFNQWRLQEDEFHLQQARLRSKIRIQDGRGKPIDYLAQYIAAEEDLEQLEPYEPYAYLQGITISDMEDLIEDIKVYKELEKGKHQDYWGDLTVIAEEELRKLRKMDRKEYEASLGRREGINQAVQQDVQAIFKGKSAEQLSELKSKIEEKLRSNSEGIDVNYWESLLSQLKAHVARARLRDRHQENLKRKVSQLKAQQGMKPTGELDKATDKEVAEPASAPSKVQPKTETVEEPEAVEDEADEELLKADFEKQERELLQRQIEEYVAGGYSPVYLKPNDLELGTLVVDEAEDSQRLEFARKQVTTMGKKVENAMTAEERRCEQEAKKGMADDEARFSVESAIEQNYSWSDKYRPRKPRYFNRVHTGFEWNKYNQTHYDIDNPPPKIVQGYKFNIFYPDLINKSTTPQYTVTPCADNKEFAILRISAGPPYEDIAFKIVNREWEYSYKRGFRCQFHNNIFQMWFHFKRYRYRR